MPASISAKAFVLHTLPDFLRHPVKQDRFTIPLRSIRMRLAPFGAEQIYTRIQSSPKDYNMESLVAICKDGAVSGMEMFLRNFSFVPDDKVAWTPTPTAKSAIRIAAHTALYAAKFAWMIRERTLPPSETLSEWIAQRDAAEVAITNRSEIEGIFRSGTDEVIAALDSLTPEAIGSTLGYGPGGGMPMTFLMKLPGLHATLHTGQIDFLQTCWDDQEVYV